MKRKLLLASALLLATALSPARAQVIDDPLHGEVCAGGNGTCTNSGDNGTNTPIANFQTTFGFSSSPTNTGDLILKFLIPNNDSVSGLTTVHETINGTSSTGTLTLAAGTWTTGTLEAFLGIPNASPDNPIGAYLPSTKLVDAGATGFTVLTLNVGQINLPDVNATLPDLFTVANFAAPAGSYVLGDLILASGADVTTANSAALFVGSVSAVPEPATWGMMLIGFVGLAFAFRQRRRVMGIA
jgi:hypothetical protein